MKKFEQEKLTKTPAETQKIAAEILKKVKLPHVFALYGNLGSGKTTFTQGLAQELGLSQKVTSPTFVIERRYPFKKGTFYHLDLYRLQDTNSNFHDLREVFEDENGLIVIEWPEQIESLLPKHTTKIRFEQLNETERKITVT